MLLAGCSHDKQNKNPQIKIPQNSYLEEITKAVEKGATLKEIPDPKLEIPSEIHPKQMNKFFALDNLLIATVVKPSINIYLEGIQTNEEFRGENGFAGLLIAEKTGKKWEKIHEIQDKNSDDSTQNNPYYLWTDTNKLFLSVVDANGAGSGEGVMKVLIFNNNEWKLESCHYFIPDINPALLEKYKDEFAISSQISIFQPIKKEKCSNDLI